MTDIQVYAYYENDRHTSACILFTNAPIWLRLSVKGTQHNRITPITC